MNDFQVFSVITKKDLKNKGFVVHRKRNHPDAFYTKVTKDDVEGYIYFNDKNQIDIFPERDILLAQELCKAFPDIQIISDDQLYEYAHLTEDEQTEKFTQMVEETVKRILSYDPTKRVELVAPNGLPATLGHGILIDSSCAIIDCVSTNNDIGDPLFA